jgi:hypothetical protein
MVHHSQRVLLSLLAAGALLVLLLFVQSTLTDPVRAETATMDYFASSTGSGTLCAMNQPCLITVALSLAGDGDTIYVAQGTYTTTATSVVLVSNSITLYGGWDGLISFPVTRNPKLYPTILDGEYARRVVLINSSITPTIDGFFITRGSASNSAVGQGKGGGIYSRYASPLIANNVISSNIADTSIILNGYGGGVCVEDPGVQAVITDNVVYSNVASLYHRGYGGGIHVEGGTLPQQIENNVLLSNTASITGGEGTGGGISLISTDSALLRGNTIEHNVGTASSVITDVGDGGGIYCFMSDDVDIVSNTVQYNSASLISHGGGGGIRTLYCEGMSIISNTIRYNTSTDPDGSGEGAGGGVLVYHSLDVTLGSNLVISNTAHRGGGIFVGSATSFTMTNNIVAENYAGLRGGGISIEAGTGEPITGTLVHNTLAANNSGIGAGRNGINVPWSDVTLVLTNNMIITHQYGIAIGASSSANLDHTLFYGNTTDTYSLGTLINSNAITGQNPLLDSTYHLMSGSPAIAAGATLGWPSFDIDGDPRRSRSPAIGADAFDLPFEVCLPLILESN